ncbi:hypothetical protein COCVIDRAFT_26833 [Bipolaris victoriae FI3]|uniref:PH domain-containing protein n=1 Tax=Bipolaris victoriae (strain FI3) TaxID=930091 RepID=W7ELW5_BIPV3|nr:hypothetical protein COCVIDRAFT_26833 [Bipolaris victoriae FI3]
MADLSARPPMSRWRLTRSTANLREAAREAARSPSVASKVSVPAPPKTLERVSSRMSLFNLFSKPKVEKARGHTEVGLAVPMRPQTPPKPTAPMSIPKSSLRQNPSPPAQQTIRARASQRFRPISMRSAVSYNEFGDWEPPPLFQAFPQSIKHATVQACVFAPEVLMRTQSQRRQAESLLERIDHERELSTITENSTEAKKLEKSHKRLISHSVLHPPTPELVNKIYVLVTSGYILQYAGDGPFDRVPEKVLKLGKESAAFACDLIPGKHWVLQISSHASDDGALEVGPKSSILARLRTQHLNTRRSVTSFLLVLESAEEMDEWMTSVRREIDNLGGTRTRDDSARASCSTDGGSVSKESAEIANHRFRVSRDAYNMSKVVPIEPRLSASPKIITSDWETNPEQTKRSIDSSSGQSHRQSSRLSVETSSATSTPVSQHQMQLEQLRGRSRYSFMSSSTSFSGAGTQNTSRESSPAPQSPLMEECGATGDNEPLRSAMSLRSFQMNPNSSMSSRRRSMQPLPTTDENLLQTAETLSKNLRHSLYSPASPTFPGIENPLAAGPIISVNQAPSPDQPQETEIGLAYSSPPELKNDIPDQPEEDDSPPTREDSPVRFNAHVYSSPPRRDVISPPPKEPAPLPPPPARRQSIMGNTTTTGMSNPAPYLASTSKVTGTRRRTSGSPKPFLRPIPVRPQAQHIDSARRRASQTPSPTPSISPLIANRSVTAPIRPASAASNMTTSPSLHGLNSAQSNPLRRPASVQIRSDRAPFLSSRPLRLISSTPSFVPGQRMSIQAVPTTTNVQAYPNIEALRQRTLAQQTSQKTIVVKHSLSSIGLPPPAPPPNMPLPPPPRNITSPTPPPSIPLPPPPPTADHPVTPLSMPLSPLMGLPAPPPTAPLPPTPPEVALRASIV